MGRPRTQPQDSIGVLLKLEPQLKERIDDYRFDHRISARMTAIRQLLDIGLQAVSKKK